MPAPLLGEKVHAQSIHFVCIAFGFLFDLGVAQQPMDDSEIRDLLSGKSAIFSDYGTAVYHSNGRYTFTRRSSQSGAAPTTGKWAVSAGRICIDFDNGRSRCDRVMRDATSAYVVASDGAMYRLAIGPIDTDGQKSMNTSERVVPLPNSIKVNIQPANPLLLPNLQRFIGKWGGKWPYAMEADIYIERVGTDGAAEGVYAWDDNWSVNISRGAVRFRGQISDSTLTWNQGRVRLEFTLLSDGTLRGYRHASGESGYPVIMRRLSYP